MAKKLKVDMTHAYASDGITIARRHPDEKLLATFSFSGQDIQVDENGTSQTPWVPVRSRR